MLIKTTIVKLVVMLAKLAVDLSTVLSVVDLTTYKMGCVNNAQKDPFLVQVALNVQVAIQWLIILRKKSAIIALKVYIDVCTAMEHMSASPAKMGLFY